jgi:hypothetical protein
MPTAVRDRFPLSGRSLVARLFAMSALCAACWIAVFDLVINRNGTVMTYLLTDSSSTVKWLMGLMPDALGVRVANAMGYRFNVAAYEAPWQFYVISIGIEWLLLTILIYVVVTIARGLRRLGGSRSGDGARLREDGSRSGS